METKTRTQRFYKLLLSLAFLGFLFPVSQTLKFGVIYSLLLWMFFGPGSAAVRQKP